MTKKIIYILDNEEPGVLSPAPFPVVSDLGAPSRRECLLRLRRPPPPSPSLQDHPPSGAEEDQGQGRLRRDGRLTLRAAEKEAVDGRRGGKRHL